ncbi:hypothetical protein ANCCAN_25134 [Ancylostoma caninum]|uniref:Uncharacterized protein n=1 Tax=Ancylostoma caninum TaxID=29170 RepID=A0A368FA97_ANCCA|nr:hypothetical protein ANCCAN_25134 [Ancylostoma caninum]
MHFEKLASVKYSFAWKCVFTGAWSVAAAIVLAILNIVPILMVIIGSLNRHDCAVNSNIPVWLIVTGTVSLIRSAINFFFRFKDQQKQPRPILVRLFDGILSVFFAIW